MQSAFLHSPHQFENNPLRLGGGAEKGGSIVIRLGDNLLCINELRTRSSGANETNYAQFLIAGYSVTNVSVSKIPPVMVLYE